jgi:hypothetical protein
MTCVLSGNKHFQIKHDAEYRREKHQKLYPEVENSERKGAKSIEKTKKKI